MDQDRQIRFAIPPFFLFASLLWGAYLGGMDLGPIFKPDTTKEVLGVIATAAVALVPIGFVISTFSIAILRFAFWVARKPTYEAMLDKETLGSIWKRLKLPGEPEEKETLYIAATFDHEC